MVPNTWLRLGSRMSNSTYYDPSVADASHGYLPPLSLQESQADANNRLNRAIQRKILLAYIQFKNSAAFSANDAPAYFADYLHSTVCCRYACRCTKFFSLASHYDGCHDARCDICNTVQYNAVVDTFHPDFEHVKGSLLRVTGSGNSGQPRYDSSEAMQPLPKRLKLENPTAPSFPYHGMFYTMAPLNIQPSYAELPPLVRLSESPVSYNSEVGVEWLPKLLDGSTVANRMGMNMEVNTELLPYLLEDSTSAKEMGKTMEMNIEWLPKLMEDSSNAKETGKDVAESFPGPPEVAIAGYEVVETDAVGSHREEDIGFINVIDNADNARGHFNNLEINALPSFSEELAAGCEEGETEARANYTNSYKHMYV